MSPFRFASRSHLPLCVQHLDSEQRRKHEIPSSRADSPLRDRKSTRLNSSHRCISYAVFCLKKIHSSPGKASPRPPCPSSPASVTTDVHRERDLHPFAAYVDRSGFLIMWWYCSSATGHRQRS